MSILEEILIRFIGLFMPIDFIIFVVILYLMKKVKRWGVRIFSSLAIYLFISEVIKYILDGNSDFVSTISMIIGLSILSWFSSLLSNESITESSRKTGKPLEGYGCPSCYAEYLKTFDVCADCEIPLVNFEELVK